MNNVHEDGPVRVRVALGAVVPARPADAATRSKSFMKDRRPISRPRPPPGDAARTKPPTRISRHASNAIRKSRRCALIRAEDPSRRGKSASRATGTGARGGAASGGGLETAVSAGATIFTAIFGRKKLSYPTIGREHDHRARRRSGRCSSVTTSEHAKENLAAAQEELDALNADLEEKIARIRVT